MISAWGVGGGTLLLLVMTLFLGVDHRTAQGLNLLFFLPTAASALFCHARNDCLDKPCLKNAVPFAVAAALIGAWISNCVDVNVLRKPFGVYLRLLALACQKGEIRVLIFYGLFCRSVAFGGQIDRFIPDADDDFRLVFVQIFRQRFFVVIAEIQTARLVK